MKAYAVIYNVSGSTQHVDVYSSKERAINESKETGGIFVSGINNIIKACTWWSDTDSRRYRKEWVLDNMI